MVSPTWGTPFSRKTQLVDQGLDLLLKILGQFSYIIKGSYKKLKDKKKFQIDQYAIIQEGISLSVK